jgi:hypothetical protein
MDTVITQDIFRGAVLSFIYFEITKANDTTLYNMFIFTVFYVVFSNIAYLIGIETSLITNAFITKAVFTLVDERIRKQKPEKQKN